VCDVCAIPVPDNRCAGAKIKATGKKASCMLGAEAKAASKGGSPDTTKCVAKFEKAFGKVEAKGECVTTGDQADIEAKVDAFVADVDSKLDVATPNKCQGFKLKAAGKKAACLLSLEAKNASKGVVPVTDKVAKCESKLSTAFSKAEAKGGCSTTGDAQEIEEKVDAFVGDANAELLGGGSPSGAFVNY